MSYLIDTNVISELRKGRRCDSNVSAWFASLADDEVYLSALTIGEIRRGTERIRRRDSKAAKRLDQWLGSIVEQYGEAILPVDRAVAERWGRLNVPDPLPLIDGLLAATALEHDLTLATRNVKDVARSGSPCVNPFEKGEAARPKRGRPRR